MSGIVYDTGALLAAERRHRGVWALHEQSLVGGVRPIVPVVVLAQAWRGTPHANLSRLLRGCQVAPDTEELGKAAGVICGRTGTSDVIDALVVATALRLHSLVVTSDPDDLQHLASSLHSKLAIFTV
ncbi:MAG: PIN domain-containing protein [Pseudonocardiaceae bacterium]